MERGLLLLNICLSYTLVLAIKTIGPIDFCSRETMNATCNGNEIIMMERARFGRMSVGRCVRQNLGYLGCGVDVLGLMDNRCSGRASCSVRVQDDALYLTKPCPDDTTSYLEVVYSCVPVATDPKRECQKSGSVTRTEPSGLLASRMSLDTGLGSPACPWTIKLTPGQRINITLINFARATGLSTQVDGLLQQDSSVCYQLGTLREGTDSKQILICGSDGREKNIYISRTNQVTVHFEDKTMLKMLGYFAIKYEAAGCADPVLPRGSWLRRTGNSASIRCNLTEESWALTCRDGRWTGRVGNCSQVPGGPGIFNETDFPYGILIVVSIGVALGVFFGGLLLSIAIFYVKRRHGPPRPQPPSRGPPPQPYSDPRMPYRDAKDLPDDLPQTRATWGTYGSSGYGSQLPEDAMYPRDNLKRLESYDSSTLPHPDKEARHHIYESPQFS